MNELILNKASYKLLSKPLHSIYSSYRNNWQYAIFIATQSNMIGATGSYHKIGKKVNEIVEMFSDPGVYILYKVISWIFLQLLAVSLCC